MHPAAQTVIAEWLEETVLPDLVERDVTHPALESLNQILAVVGPRRAGKTFYFFQQIHRLLGAGKSKQDILMVDFEDYRLAGLRTDPMGELLEAFHALTGHLPEYLFLDEIQQLPDWSRVLRTLHNQRKFKIVISGSNSQLLARELATELRGRCLETRLLPFSFAEFLRLKGREVTPAQWHTAARGSIQTSFLDYLHHGGFPDVAMADTPMHRRQLLQGYFETIYYKDILERHEIRAKGTLEAMMRHLLDQAGDLFSISAFSRTLEARGLHASKRTLANYLGYLEGAFFVIPSEKFAYSQRKRTANPVKCYLFDTGLRQLGIPFSENRGKLLENLVAIELRRRQKEFFYFREKVDCDFVIAESGRPTACIQVCWELNDSNRQREVSGLRAAAEALGTRDNVILTQGQAGEDSGVTLKPIVPWLLGWG
jgi:hypothetical protein